MSRLHLATNRGPLCARRPAPRTAALTGCLAEVTCLHCLKQFDAVSVEEAGAARERAVMRRYEEQARQIGLGPIWDHLTRDDTPTTELLRGVFGAVASYLIETGYEEATR